MANIRYYEGSKKWQAVVRKKGYPPKSKMFKLKSDAEKWVREVEGAMDRNTFVDNKDAETTTLSQALDLYSDYAKSKNDGFEMELNRIERWKTWEKGKLANRPLITLKSKDFEDYRDIRRLDGISDATIRLDLAVIAAMFKHFDFGMDTPTSRVTKTLQKAKERNRRLTDEEEKYLMDQLDDTQCSDPKRANKWIPITARFAIATSARRCELLGHDKTKHSPAYPGLLWENIDFELNVCEFKDTKNGSDRFCPLSPIALECLEQARKLSPAKTGSVFLTTNSAIKQAWARAKKRAQEKYKTDGGEDENFLVDFRWHDNRHESASRWANEFGILELMNITGHKDHRSVIRYVNPNKSDVARISSKMSKIAK